MVMIAQIQTSAYARITSSPVMSSKLYETGRKKAPFKLPLAAHTEEPATEDALEDTLKSL